jgi:hypothetical protein
VNTAQIASGGCFPENQAWRGVGHGIISLEKYPKIYTNLTELLGQLYEILAFRQ